MNVGGAILDVLEAEPLPLAYPLRACEHAVIAPHMSGPSRPEEIAPTFNEGLGRDLAGRPLRHVVAMTPYHYPDRRRAQ